MMILLPVLMPCVLMSVSLWFLILLIALLSMKNPTAVLVSLLTLVDALLIFAVMILFFVGRLLLLLLQLASIVLASVELMFMSMMIPPCLHLVFGSISYVVSMFCMASSFTPLYLCRYC